MRAALEPLTSSSRNGCALAANTATGYTSYEEDLWKWKEEELEFGREELKHEREELTRELPPPAPTTTPFPPPPAYRTTIEHQLTLTP